MYQLTHNPEDMTNERLKEIERLVSNLERHVTVFDAYHYIINHHLDYWASIALECIEANDFVLAARIVRAFKPKQAAKFLQALVSWKRSCP